MKSVADQPTACARPDGARVFASDLNSTRSGTPAQDQERERTWPFVASSPKTAGFGLHRTVSPEATYESLRPYFRRIGITRVADITGLDFIGIPVYSAKVPRSRDSISVYHGKGFTAIDAKTGAVMEATERFIASRDRLPDEVASYNELSRRALTVDPRRINQILHPTYRDDVAVAWLRGTDLLSGEQVFVPHSLAVFSLFSYPWQPCHALATSNGLASGNSLEEAACHALAEVVERDAHTTYEVFQRQLDVISKRGGNSAQAHLDRARHMLNGRFPIIDPAGLPERPRSLLAKFEAAGFHPQLVFAGAECGAATVLSFMPEPDGSGFSSWEYGAGADPNIAVAAVRALSELAQGRAAYREACREDLQVTSRTTPEPSRAGTADLSTGSYHVAFAPERVNRVSLNSLPSRSTTDIMDDIRLMLAGMRSEGIERCVMLDLSIPDLPVKVVRIIAPGMESWIVDHGKVGPRAKARWRDFAATI